MKFLSKATTAISVLAGRGGLTIKAHSPEILLAMGIGGLVTAAVLACRSTLKVEEVLEEHREKTEKIAEVWEKVEDGEIPIEKYTEKEHQKDLAVVYTQTAVNFIKLYGPAITLGVASIACLISGHGIMKKRNVALMAAYKAIEEGFAAYRKRVIEEHGEEADYMYKHGLHKMEVTDMAYTDEDGKKHKAETRTEYVGGPTTPSPYAKYFDESCTQWTKNADYNLQYLLGVQDYFNKILQGWKHVFLNEVYDHLGIERTEAGTVVGWIFGSENGDDKIDFGIYDKNKPDGLAERARAFVNGHERSILLDFNVDGPIQKLFTKKEGLNYIGSGNFHQDCLNYPHLYMYL